ncbi:formate dehydrogenase subunit delta [Pseudogulbenkiania ferrooxidans]|uniref:Formate dehydrogenase delta subunit n=1 Tax=Pseudogulbenkiania ferrooxidans 2002 TaxID=279714 RepID=B9Z499_9NEIS|nr:formate dehydrogenase subunit delta [Pseudogulbenkiania ferrooxidans]EEG08676.1 formate dehydrogenase delta subunit [Pseudogulbenkiania ferrooxidans 2002]
MDTHHLTRMANQIGSFFEAMPDRQEALAGISQHIKRFWEPRMRRELQQYLQQGDGAELSGIVLEALQADDDWKV